MISTLRLRLRHLLSVLMLDSKMMDVKRNKMKKTVIHKFLALVIAIGLASCDDKLDLSPAQSIDEGQALTTDSNVKSVLVGAYNDLGNGSLFGGNILRDSELAIRYWFR